MYFNYFIRNVFSIFLALFFAGCVPVRTGPVIMERSLLNMIQKDFLHIKPLSAQARKMLCLVLDNLDLLVGKDEAAVSFVDSVYVKTLFDERSVNFMIFYKPNIKECLISIQGDLKENENLILDLRKHNNLPW